MILHSVNVSSARLPCWDACGGSTVDWPATSCLKPVWSPFQLHLCSWQQRVLGAKVSRLPKAQSWQWHWVITWSHNFTETQSWLWTATGSRVETELILYWVSLMTSWCNLTEQAVMISLSSFYLQKVKKKIFANPKILKDLLRKGHLSYMMLDLINQRTIHCCTELFLLSLCICMPWVNHLRFCLG